jgi:hypothetical protein
MPILHVLVVGLESPFAEKPEKPAQYGIAVAKKLHAL